ncbi:hypothetical protein L6R52_41700, partial [Myxococcota bacterium]|nr:hypothetical protein [Myxococcota bacterium]
VPLGDADAATPAAPRAGEPAGARAAAPAPTSTQDLSPEERELIDKVTRLADRRFGGDLQRMFRHYAGQDQRISSSELTTFLTDAGVGNFLTRGAWVDGIMERLDTSHDGKLAWSELSKLLPGG